MNSQCSRALEEPAQERNVKKEAFPLNEEKTLEMARERPMMWSINLVWKYILYLSWKIKTESVQDLQAFWKQFLSLFVWKNFFPFQKGADSEQVTLIIFQQSWHQNRSSNNILMQGLKMSFFNHKITNCLSCKKIKKMNVSLLSSSWYLVLYGEKLTSSSFTNVKIWDMSLSFPARNHKELIVFIFQLNLFQSGTQLLS